MSIQVDCTAVVPGWSRTCRSTVHPWRPCSSSTDRRWGWSLCRQTSTPASVRLTIQSRIWWSSSWMSGRRKRSVLQLSSASPSLWLRQQQLLLQPYTWHHRNNRSTHLLVDISQCGGFNPSLFGGRGKILSGGKRTETQTHSSPRYLLLGVKGRGDRPLAPLERRHCHSVASTSDDMHCHGQKTVLTVL